MMANAYFAEPEEFDEDYLAEAEHEHAYALWDAAAIFEDIPEGGDTKYSDFSQAMFNDWKVVSFEIKVYGLNGTLVEKDLFAVRR